MVLPPEIYTGAQFTIRYDQAQTRIPDYYEWDTEEDDGNGGTVTVHHSLPFGFEAAFQKAVDMGLIVPLDIPYFIASLPQIGKRLVLRDMFKELSAETPDAWIMLCMQRWCEVTEKYEDVLAMEAATGFDVTNPNKESRIIEYGHIINGQVQDTPYGQLDDTSDYVTGKTAEQHSGEDKIHERNELDAEILIDFRKKWDTTVNKIVEEFDVLFIRITGAGFVA